MLLPSHRSSAHAPAPPAPALQAVERDELNVAVDLAALGPRRDPLPMASDLAEDWVQAVAEGKVGSKETSVDMEAEVA